MIVSLPKRFLLSHANSKNNLTFIYLLFLSKKKAVHKYINPMEKCDAALLTTFPYHRYSHASNASASADSVPPQTEEVTFLCAATYRTGAGLMSSIP